jgi:hypothetical protein
LGGGYYSTHSQAKIFVVFPVIRLGILMKPYRFINMMS